ncbi:MAG: Hsp20/alpha crystallin family protein [Provencibacterium sp.]|jgi:HSP20 family protein|nr:Hsp20/alpha crystallin family protein [Provencibacterium sp.]
MLDLMPWGRDERRLWNAFDNFSQEFFRGMDQTSMEFKTDVLDRGDRFVLQAELPGFAKEEIQIGLEGDRLTIRAAHSEETEEKGEGDTRYIRRERRFGSFARSFDVSGVETGRIEAKYENGLLELALPKKGKEVPESRNIAIQ